jgi:hypothetical protein
MNFDELPISSMIKLEVGDWIIDLEGGSWRDRKPFEIDTGTMLDVVGLAQDKWNIPLNLEENFRPVRDFSCGMSQI